MRAQERNRYERKKVATRVVIVERYKQLFRALNPVICKYLTTRQILELWDCKTQWEIDAAQRALVHLFDAEYLDRPKEQRKTPNNRSKNLVYQRTDKAARHVGERNVLAHRSNSFPHELVTDFFFSFPMLYWAKHVPGLKLTTTLELMNGAVIETEKGDFQIPLSTRESKDPFKIDGVRFDTTPMVIGNGENIVFIPGIQTDRNTENFSSKTTYKPTLARHIDDIMCLIKSGRLREHYGFKAMLFPILCTHRAHMDGAKKYLHENHGARRDILFKSVPDLIELEHFPPIASDLIDAPWERVGHPNFDLKTLSEVL